MPERPRGRAAGGRAPLSERARKAQEQREKERVALAGLIEVERAIAALEGRNVEDAEQMMHLRRDAEQRRANLDRIIASSHAEIDRRERALPWKIAGAVVVLGAVVGLGLLATRLVRARLGEREAALAAAAVIAKPFEGRFAAPRTAVGDESVVVEARAGRCFVAVAGSAGGAVRVRIERQGTSREAAGSIGWCSCKAEDVRVSGTGPEPVATIVLEAAANAIGGADGLAATAPRPGATFAEALDRPCAEAAFDAWAAAQPRERRAPEQLGPEEQALAADGLVPVALAAADAPFVLLPAATDVCMLALGRSGQPLSLRRTGGERPLAVKWGALGFCAKDTSALSVWREGTGEVTLFAAPRARVGGLLGLRELVTRAGIPIQAWTAPDELEADARAALDASGIGSVSLGFAPERGEVLAISTDARGALGAGDAGRDAACRPALDVGVIQSLCIEARGGAFKPVGALPSAIVRGSRPLWLVSSAAPDSLELARSLDVMAFARRMSAQGFELTSLVGATPTREGATITGRNREKEILAVTLTGVPPYLHILSATTPWTLAEPRPTPLAPGEVLKLRATPAFPPGATKREIVVWRR